MSFFTMCNKHDSLSVQAQTQNQTQGVRGHSQLFERSKTSEGRSHKIGRIDVTYEAGSQACDAMISHIPKSAMCVSFGVKNVSKLVMIL